MCSSAWQKSARHAFDHQEGGKLLAILNGRTLGRGDFYHDLCSREVKSWNVVCRQDIEKFQTCQSGQPSCLAKRQAFFTQVVDSRCKTCCLGNLFWLLA